MSCISIIAAVDKNFLIGRENELPWHLPADLKYFKNITMGKPILMGRKTFESIGKPLPGRRNIVISRQSDFMAQGCEVVSTLDEAIALVANVEEIMIVGGATLFQQFLPRADRLYLTQIDASFEGEIYFPTVNFNDWVLLKKEEHLKDEKNQYDYRFLVLERKLSL